MSLPRLLARCALALVCLAPGVARGQSCDERRVCCEQWIVETWDGGVHGAYVEDSYPALLARVERARRTDAQLCRYFGPQSSSCATRYDAPRCVASRRAPPASERGLALGDRVRAAREALARIRRSSGALARLARGAARVVGAEREGFGRFSITLEEYAAGLDNAVARVERLRVALEALQSAQMEQVVSDANAVEVEPLMSLWRRPGTSGFASSDAQDRLVREAIDAQRELEAAERMRVPEVRTVEIPEQATVVRAVSSSRRRLVFGEHGAPEQGATIGAGSVPVALVGEDGGLESAEVRVDERVREDGSRRITITARGTANELVLDVAPPDRDRDGVADARDACPEHAGERPGGCPACPQGATFDRGAGRCLCGAQVPLYDANTRTCRACPGGQRWDGAQCVLPPRAVVTTARPGGCMDGSECWDDPMRMQFAAECTAGSQGACQCTLAGAYGCHLQRGCYAGGGAPTPVTRAQVQQQCQQASARAYALGMNCGIPCN